MRVETAHIEEAELVHRIMREAYLEYDGALEPPMSGSGESAAQVADAMRRGGAVLAWDDVTPVGCARYRLSSEFVHIKRVSVLPPWRGRGIATAMLRYIESLAVTQGRTQARLQVRMSLPQNLELYTHRGYEIAQVKAHPRGQDEVGTLVKRLDCGVSVQAFRLLRGPNVHYPEPVMEALIEVSDHTLQGVAHDVGRLTLEIQQQLEYSVSFFRAQRAEVPGTYRVLVAYGQEQTARPAFDLAVMQVRTALAHEPVDVAREMKQLMRLADNYRLGPSSAAIVAAAKERGIPAVRPTWALRPGEHIVQLGWGVHRKHIHVSETSATSAIASRLSKKKPRTNTLLRSLGVPVPAGRTVRSADEAWQAAMELGLPVVTKPEAGGQGKGVSAGLQTEEQVRSGYDVAEARVRSGQFKGGVMVEHEIDGNEYRLVVVNGRLEAACQLHPAQVVGDGQRTVRELVQVANSDPRRRPRKAEWYPIVLDEAASLALAQQDLTFDSIPEAGQAVRVRQNTNLSSGGLATDVTDTVHPFNARMAELAAGAVGLDVAGVDMMCHDIARPMVEQGGAILEVNSRPGFQGALFPVEGQRRQVGRPIVEMLFPTGTPSRIPLIAILGSPGTAGLGARVVSICEAAGQIVGLSTPEGASVGGQRLEPDDSSQQAGTCALLLHPLLESLVVETTPETVLEQGLPFDRCDVAIVTVDDPNGTARVLEQTLDPAGTLILTGDRPDNGAVDEHTARGGRGVVTRDDRVVLDLIAEAMAADDGSRA